MGLLVLPINETFTEIFTVNEITNQAAERTIPIGLPDTPRLDRQWEVLAVNIPSVSVGGTLAVTASAEGPNPAEYLAAWRQSVSLNYSFDLLLSGLVVSSVGSEITVSPPTGGYNNGSTPVVVFDYLSGSLSLSQSLQNPILVKAPEQLQAQLKVSAGGVQLFPFIYEREEGSGESKHSVKIEIGLVEFILQLHFQLTTPTLYINESSSIKESE